MRKASKGAVLIALALSLVMILPGAYAAEAGGEVAGTVNLAGTGIPLTGCANTQYTFQDVVLRGAIRNNAGAIFTGSLDTNNVKGNSTMCETTGAGAGVVNSALDPATISTVPGAGNVGIVTGTFYGTYVRTESVVIVDLQVTVSINNTAPFTIPVKVRSQFTPTAVTPAGITAANFAGVWSHI